MLALTWQSWKSVASILGHIQKPFRLSPHNPELALWHRGKCYAMFLPKKSEKYNYYLLKLSLKIKYKLTLPIMYAMLSLYFLGSTGVLQLVIYLLFILKSVLSLFPF